MRKSSGAVASHVVSHVALAAYLLSAFSPVLIAPAYAQSNEDVRRMTVMQRPREAYDAQGVAVGEGFRLNSSLGVSEAYDDNIYATHSNTVSDFETLIAPSISLDSNWSRHAFSISGYGKIHRYADRTTEDNEEYGAAGYFRLDLARGGTLNFTGSYDRQTLSRTDPENAQRITPEQVNIIRGGVSFRQQFSRLLIGADAGYTDWNEVSSLDAEKNRHEYTGSVRAGYVLSPALNVFVEPSYTVRNFERSASCSGGVSCPFPDHDSQIFDISLGAGYDITGILYGETTVGWYSDNFAAVGIPNATGISVKSSTTWNVTARDSFILTVRRESDVTTQVFGASSNQRTSFELDLQHELLRNVVLQANVSYANEDYTGSQAVFAFESIPGNTTFLSSAPTGTGKRQDDVYQAGIEADYFINRHFSLYAQYQFYKRNSNSVNFDVSTGHAEAINTYDDNRIMIGVKVKL